MKFLKEIKKIIIEIFCNIKKNKNIFFSSIASLTMVFTFLNIFTFVILTVNDYKADKVNENQIIIYLHNIEAERKNELQKKILRIEGVSSIKYESKQEALNNIKDVLEVELNDDENPLNDAFYVYLNNDTNVKKLKVELSNLEEINTVELKEQQLINSIAFNKNLDNIIIRTGIILISFSLIIVYSLTNLYVKSREKDIKASFDSLEERQYIRVSFIFETIATIIISSLIGYFIYSGLRTFVIQGISILSPSFINIVSKNSEKIIAVIFTIITIIISLIINAIDLKKYYSKKNKKEIENVEV